MPAGENRNILWEVGCEGHTDAWVTAKDWEMATVEAARFWGVSWAKVAARCECKNKIVGAPRNICRRCQKVFYGSGAMCLRCLTAAKTEEERMQQALRRDYRTGKLV